MTMKMPFRQILLLYILLFAFPVMAQWPSGQGIAARSTNGAVMALVVGSNNIVVMKSSGTAKLQVPYQTLNSANTAASAGDTIVVGPGYYTGHDLGKDGVNWHFESGAIADWDGDATGSSSLFTDNTTLWQGNFAQSTNSLSFRITGGLICTNINIQGHFMALAGPKTDVSVEMDLLSSTNRETTAYLCLVNNYDFPAAASYMLPRFNLSARRISDCCLYNSEFGGVVNSELYTNVFFYMDRDTTNNCQDLVFNGGEALSCNIFNARPSKSRTVFNIPRFSSGAPGTLLSKTLRGMALCWFGELVFQNCMIVQYTNSAANFFDLNGDTDSFATVDNVTAPRLTLNNCSFLGRNGGSTNIVDWSIGGRTNHPTLCILGQLIYQNGGTNALPRLTCPGSFSEVKSLDGSSNAFTGSITFPGYLKDTRLQAAHLTGYVFLENLAYNAGAPSGFVRFLPDTTLDYSLDGQLLTNLDAANITGTIPLARIPSLYGFGTNTQAATSWTNTHNHVFTGNVALTGTLIAGNWASAMNPGTFSLYNVRTDTGTAAGTYGEAQVTANGAEGWLGLGWTESDTGSMTNRVLRTVSGFSTNSVTDFVIGTRYTNGTQRTWISASFYLVSAAAGTAAVNLKVEQAFKTNMTAIALGNIAAATATNTLQSIVAPGAFFYFTDGTSGSGASATIVAGSSSRIEL